MSFLLRALFILFVHVCIITAEHAIGEQCTGTAGAQADCTDTHAICLASGKCDCEDGFNGPAAGTCSAIPQHKVNAACNDQNACTGTHVTCKNNFCKCSLGFTANKGEDDCVAEHKIGALCTPAGGGQGDCADINAVCSAARKCECKDRFSGPDGGDCILEHTIGAACTPTDGSKADCNDANAICPAAGRCECKAGYIGSAGEKCIAEHTIGAICTPSAGGKGDCGETNAVCSTAGKCECKDGFSGSIGGKCTAIPDGKVNAACDATKKCTGAHVACEQNFCKCTEGFAANKGDDDCGNIPSGDKGRASGNIISPLFFFLAPVSMAVFVGH